MKKKVEIKKRIKNWYAEHRSELMVKGGIAIGVLLYVLGYQTCKRSVNRDYDLLVAHNPEIKGLIEKASEEIINDAIADAIK